MKKSRFTEERIIYALRQAESATPVTDVRRQLGVSEASFYVWKKKYGKLGHYIHVMPRRDGWPVNKKQFRRLYWLEGLQLRMRIRRCKHICLHRGPAPQPTAPGERWSRNFVRDQLFDGRPFRMLTVVDQLNRESPLIEVDFSMSGHKVAAALDRRLADGPVPISLTVDHGTEFTSKALEEWAGQRGIKLDFTRPGKPMDNGHIEPFNGRLRDEFLNVNRVLSIEDPRATIEAWRIDYNRHRPHGSLEYLTPSEFIQNRQGNGAREAAIV